MAAPIKVVHLITSLNRGGAESMLLRLAAQSDSSRVRNIVLSLGKAGTLAPEFSRKGIECVELGLNRNFPTPGSVRRIREILRSQKADLLQTWLYHADFYGWLAASNQGRRIPLGWNIRCNKSGSPLPRILSWGSRSVDFAVSNSYSGKAFHEKLGYRPREWIVIPNGFDLERFRPDPSKRNEMRSRFFGSTKAPLVGMVARFDFLKDHPTFLKACGILRARHPSWKYVLVGSRCTEQNRQLKALLQDFDLGDSVFLAGESDRAEDWFNVMDLSVCSSLSEGFSNAVGESLACGVPVVATRVGDNDRLVPTDQMVEPRDPEALARSIESFISLSTEQKKARAQTGLQLIRDSYSLKAVVNQYEELYLRIAKSADAVRS